MNDLAARTRIVGCEQPGFLSRRTNLPRPYKGGSRCRRCRQPSSFSVVGRCRIYPRTRSRSLAVDARGADGGSALSSIIGVRRARTWNCLVSYRYEWHSKCSGTLRPAVDLVLSAGRRYRLRRVGLPSVEGGSPVFATGLLYTADGEPWGATGSSVRCSSTPPSPAYTRLAVPAVDSRNIGGGVPWGGGIQAPAVAPVPS